MIRNMGKSPLDPRMRHQTMILLLCCWIGMLTNSVDSWLNLLIKLTLYVKAGCSVLIDGHSIVLGTEVGYLWLTLFRL